MARPAGHLRDFVASVPKDSEPLAVSVANRGASRRLAGVTTARSEVARPGARSKGCALRFSGRAA